MAEYAAVTSRVSVPQLVGRIPLEELGRLDGTFHLESNK
jgi:hypothetical protein